MTTTNWVLRQCHQVRVTYTPLLPYTEDQLAEDIPKLGSGGRPNWAQLTRTEKQVSWELTTLVSIVDCLGMLHMILHWEMAWHFVLHCDHLSLVSFTQ